MRNAPKKFGVFFCKLQMDKKSFEAKKKFMQDFSARVDDDVVCVEMCELRTDGDSFSKMHLSLTGGEKAIWGMLVVCKKSVYFYAPHRTLAFMSMFRLDGDDAEIEEQMFCFTGLQELKFVAKTKKWIQLFSQEKIEFSFLQDGRHICGELLLLKNAVEILIKIRAALNS